jgi:hypothetical protein
MSGNATNRDLGCHSIKTPWDSEQIATNDEDHLQPSF